MLTVIDGARHTLLDWTGVLLASTCEGWYIEYDVGL
jgi:hypothetical protein